MSADLDTDTKLKIYLLVLNRYKDIINEKEDLTISEIRQRVSPYNDTIKKIRATLTKDMIPYSPKLSFFAAAQRAISYVRKIHTCEFAFNFWVNFEEMEKIQVGTSIDKAILLAALLRSLDSEDASVVVTKKGKSYVRFSWEDSQYIFVPETGSLLAGSDLDKNFEDDPPAYAFNDLLYEDYEEH